MTLDDLNYIVANALKGTEAWDDYVDACYDVLGVPPYDEKDIQTWDPMDIDVPGDFADYWIRYAA